MAHSITGKWGLDPRTVPEFKDLPRGAYGIAFDGDQAYLIRDRGAIKLDPWMAQGSTHDRAKRIRQILVQHLRKQASDERAAVRREIAALDARAVALKRDYAQHGITVTIPTIAREEPAPGEWERRCANVRHKRDRCLAQRRQRVNA